MMSCGLPVVDLDRGDNEVNYGNRRDIAKLCSPLPEKLAQEILDLLEDKKDLESRSLNGIDFSKKLPNELEMSRRVEELMLARHESNIND